MKLFTSDSMWNSEMILSLYYVHLGVVLFHSVPFSFFFTVLKIILYLCWLLDEFQIHCKVHIQMRVIWIYCSLVFFDHFRKFRMVVRKAGRIFWNELRPIISFANLLLIKDYLWIHYNEECVDEWNGVPKKIEWNGVK